MVSHPSRQPNTPAHPSESTTATLLPFPNHLQPSPHIQQQSMEMNMTPPPAHGKMHPPSTQKRPLPQNGNTEHQNVFGSVMGNPAGSGGGVGSGGGGGGNLSAGHGGEGPKIYASVYSGVPVLECMIRGISVMRRNHDSWVNATQILKVAGIPKSARTKILEKEILGGVHEKVQGGYGKYQGTWIPLTRGQELAAQFGVTSFVAPIFDFVPTPHNLAALPQVRQETPDRSKPQPTTQNQSHLHQSVPRLGPGMMVLPPQYTPSHMTDSSGRSMTQFTHGQQLYYSPQPQPQHPYYLPRPDLTPINPDGRVLAPAPEINEPSSRPILPGSMRLSTRPPRPRQTAETERIRAKLLGLFASPETPDLREVFGIPSDAPMDVDVDTIIDPHGHTALHWACAMARMPLVEQLIGFGADIHRGNFAGETPLIRSVLTTNHAESGTFVHLLTHLAPSIRTLDQAYRSVLHHIALIAGVRGRASAARTYLVGVLEWVAREQQQSQENGEAGGGEMSLKNLVDVQDVHGDTALIVAARVGNKGLVQLLLDAGADKARANKLGLKAADFGVETEALKLSPGEVVVSSLRSEVPKPERHSRDVQKNITAMFETISRSHDEEMTEKQTRLNVIEQNVRHATRSLAERRTQITSLQKSLDEFEQLSQKTNNISRILSSSSMDDIVSNPIFGSNVNIRYSGGEEIIIPGRGEKDSIGTLRRMCAWEDTVGQILEEKMKLLEGESSEKAVRYRKLVSLCTKVPVDQVDGMLDGLTKSVESDGSQVDLGRLSQLLNRIRG
ncbi:hypothetical protein TREMEDRAFT_44460 [Tremella mesenterica DSM 1558]|uniref:uncharacterized protein n=1 Tax=Tremella mesenterica (strain ATCC 24925 / CBS 8224 / DSM 1558 / NBRC 9311 / NRRL Y-6157 / RJB 2259-6 / UBC 559-6) TaxID=578456 RepID=UPI0003F49994|nr:uncharacterized protein TREMEDRAFT_44460 [Tremella mesenterica DSM 1558]EIW68619.1 hypothetical protein TREMEDRAFT_44460 [Tremella mesenterica DSM 1558]